METAAGPSVGASTLSIGGRRPYRSVAYGTWKVGGARQWTERRNSNGDDGNLVLVQLRNKRVQLGLDRNSRRMGESSPNLTRIHPSATLRSLGALPSISIDQRLCEPRGTMDCYSSTEYVEYLGGQQEDSGEAVPEPVTAALRADRNFLQTSTTERRSRVEVAPRRAPHRSHSAGADTHHAVRATSCDMKSPLSRMDSTGNMKFFRATKKFFKKIYSSATLPKKQTPTSASVETVQHPQALEKPCAPIIVDDDDDCCSSRIDDYCLNSRGHSQTYSGSTAGSYPDSGLEMDRSSTPDQSINSMTCKSDSSSNSPSVRIPEGEGVNSLFEQLRQDLLEMRERDRAILADLHRVEAQLRSVREANSSATMQESDFFMPVQSMQI